jgi:uncharacterized damage-inducible protein DinB
MKLTEFFLDELEREAAGTRSVLERVPEGRSEWKPHEKSMTLCRLSSLVAAMPGWIAMMIDQNELDLRPAGGGAEVRDEQLETRRELVEAFERNVVNARKALTNTTDEHLMQRWRFLVGGNVASEQPRYVMIRDAVFNHMAHHRGQLTVYLRLNEASVPAIYGPSADEGRFE